MTKKSPRPLDLQFDIAVQWLQVNEGDIEEHEACKAVANWIADQQFDGMVKRFAKEKGVSVVKVRRLMRAKEKAAKQS